MLDACAATKGVEQVFVASTAAVYPIADGAMAEDHMTGPMDIYGITKLATEKLASEFHLRTRIPTIVGRFFNAFGPNETNPHLFPEIQKQVLSGARALKLGNLDPKRDFIHTSDMARAMEALLNAGITGYDVFNIGRGIEYSVREIVEAFERQLGEKLTIEVDPARVRKVERMHLLADVSKLKRATGGSRAGGSMKACAPCSPRMSRSKNLFAISLLKRAMRIWRPDEARNQKHSRSYVTVGAAKYGRQRPARSQMRGLRTGSKLRVALCTDGVFPHALGGMQRHSRLLAEHLARRDDLELVVLHPHADRVFDPLLGIEEVRIAPLDEGRFYLRELWRYSGRVADALDKVKVDVVLSQGFCVWKDMHRFSDRLIVHPHGLEMFRGSLEGPVDRRTVPDGIEACGAAFRCHRIPGWQTHQLAAKPARGIERSRGGAAERGGSTGYPSSLSHGTRSARDLVRREVRVQQGIDVLLSVAERLSGGRARGCFPVRSGG
ncbi:MAG: NAD-dependent epimerase/dehydratase family protein [Flavobacteriales bacterium]|nr:NAD-dependent epimerase/dehydratase family protein [Flavobacteriales bacterium]